MASAELILAAFSGADLCLRALEELGQANPNTFRLPCCHGLIKRKNREEAAELHRPDLPPADRTDTARWSPIPALAAPDLQLELRVEYRAAARQGRQLHPHVRFCAHESYVMQHKVFSLGVYLLGFELWDMFICYEEDGDVGGYMYVKVTSTALRLKLEG
ncbi:hypothetical protein CDD83_7276 [Cordyceps sp. RAO-2017]|nr:hypothetical protein CDD83_7276 [Cordyceps sp. RAO-2017]